MSRLFEIEARLKAATGGEWTVGYDGPSRPIILAGKYDMLSLSRFENGRWTSYEKEENDAGFIAHSGGDSGDVAWLLELVRTLAAGVRAGQGAVRLQFANAEQMADWEEAVRAAEEAGV